MQACEAVYKAATDMHTRWRSEELRILSIASTVRAQLCFPAISGCGCGIGHFVSQSLSHLLRTFCTFTGRLQLYAPSLQLQVLPCLGVSPLVGITLVQQLRHPPPCFSH
jgi:hypothetical protein